MAHDFKAFPELTNGQMEFYYFESPHKQIFESFTAEVVKVHDGDTVTLRWNERDFVFPLRLSNIAAPELKNEGGAESQSWLEERINGKLADIIIDPKNRVEKWGRLLGRIELGGQDIGEESVMMGKSTPWNMRMDGVIPDFNKGVQKWA